MRKFDSARRISLSLIALIFSFFSFQPTNAQTLSFPGAQGFGRFAQGARGNATREVYVVTNLNDAGTGSFRDAVSQPGRIVTFAVGGIIKLSSDVVVKPNIYIAGQTAPGDGIVLFGKRVTFSSASNTIARYLRIRLGATGNSGNDASGLANGANMIFDHMSFSWGMDEVFSINWDSKGTAPDNITVQNSIIGQGLHRENHSAGGLIQTPDGGRVSLFRNLYISNKTRNPKVKGVNEFVNNVVYDWGNGNRLDTNLNYGWSGDAYIMGGSSGISEVNIINNYFVGGPLTPPSKTTPFSRGTGTFNLFGAGNYFDNDRNGVLNGTLVPYDSIGYPGITEEAFQSQAFPYPLANAPLTAAQAYQWIIDSVGASYPRRDQVDSLLAAEVASRGTQGYYVYRESDLPFTNGGVGKVFNAPAPIDSDGDGMPNAWEDANGLNKNNKSDATAFSTTNPDYLNIEVYVNSLIGTTPPVFVKPPAILSLNATSTEVPSPSSTVVINWQDNSDNEQNFVLERSLDNLSYTDIFHPAANATSYSNTGLVPNTTYYFRLKAVTATGDSSTYSPVVSVKTPLIPTAPVAPTTPTPANGFQYVDLGTGGSTILKWTGSSNTTTFSVYFGTDPASLTKKADVAYAAAPTYTVTGLADSITYYWRVDATNSKGTAEGTIWSFRTTKAIPAALVGHWAFDETEGRIVTDSSVYQNHGLLGLDDDDLSIRVPGKVKNALDFATANTDLYVVSIPNQDQIYLDKSSFSLSFWMKAAPSLLPQDNNTSAYILCKGSITKNNTTGATGKRFNIETKNKEFRFAIDDDVTKSELTTSGTPFFTGEWVHVVVMRDVASGKLKLYLNNTFVKEQAASGTQGIGEASALVVGNIGELEFLTTTNKPAAYRGGFDELKIFNYAISTTQIDELYNASPYPYKASQPSIGTAAALEGYEDKVTVTWKANGTKTTGFKIYAGTDSTNLEFKADVALNNPSFTFSNFIQNTTYYWRVDAVGLEATTTGSVWSYKAVSPKGLVGHWKFDETSGTTAADNSNYHVNGSVTGMTPVWTAGKFNNALQYNNPTNTGAVSVPHNEHLNFDQNSFSVSLWVKLTNGNSNYNSATPAKDCYLITKGQFADPGGKWYGIQLRDSTLTFAIDDAVLKSQVSVSIRKATSFNIFNNNWTNIVATRDTVTKLIKLFINGVQAGSGSYTTTGAIGKPLPVLIGNSLENKPFHDVMDDVRLYNYALSMSEISSLIAGSPLIAKATNPTPANGAANVNYGTIDLKWKGKGQTYNVYFGTAANNLQLKASALADSAYSLQDITELKQYFWRVDALRDGEMATGDVWSFTVADTVPPVVLTKNISVQLENGIVNITPDQVDNGSSDVYGIKSKVLDKTSFNCNDAGNQEVTLTITDNNDNVASAKAIVTVVMPTFYQDYDRDGFGNDGASTTACMAPVGYVSIGGDCNDKNSTVHPGAEELPDNMDNNCNGQVDETLVLNTYYHDYDRDGFGNDGASIQASVAPVGYVTIGGDCNDKNSTVYPGATEIGDNLDNNCNGQVDEGLSLTTFYQDYDRDGYGNSSAWVKASKSPGAGWVTVGGDCSDEKNGIHPGATEVLNGIDDNCNGAIDEGLSGVSVSNEAVEETMTSARIKVSASPNPTSNSFTLSIQSKNDKLMQIRVLNMLGSVVEQRLNVVPNSTIKIGGSYGAGIYFLEVVQGTERKIEKLVKE